MRKTYGSLSQPKYHTHTIYTIRGASFVMYTKATQTAFVWVLR